MRSLVVCLLGSPRTFNCARQEVRLFVCPKVRSLSAVWGKFNARIYNMADNKSLAAANKAKKDEFYTQLDDIANELKHYAAHFKDKTVLCNCDDPYESNFFKFFALKFNTWGLKKLICTCYGGSMLAQKEFNFDGASVAEGSADVKRVAYKLELTEVFDKDKNGAVDLEDVKLILKANPPKRMKGDGDFRSEECVEILKEADIVVTNPPFSLFREYVAQLVEYDKKFLIVGNQNAITYKEVFPLLKANGIWLGVNAGDMAFKVPDDYEERSTRYWQDDAGQKWRSLGTICWFTNLDHKKRHEPLDLYKHYTLEEYPTYANYDAIEVGKTSDIPMDYDGVMGVPKTFMDKYCPEQFEIVGTAEGESGRALGLKPFPRELKKLNPSLRDGQLYYIVNGRPIKPFARILIRRKQQETTK